jgi:uncharacterized protein YbjQ (UPF0145 family)
MSEAILDRVKKLIALGTANKDEHEASTAMALAEKLMQKFSITEEMLKASGPDTSPKEEIRVWEQPLWEGGKNRSQWRNQLAVVLCNYHACVMWTENSTIQIAGRSSDVQTVRYLFDYCESWIDIYSQRYKGNGKGWINNWKLGVVTAITEKLRIARKEARDELIKEHGQKATNAIVKVDNKTAEVRAWYQKYSEENGFVTRAYGKQSVNERARNTGYRDGQKIELGSGPGLKAGYKGLPDKD